MQATSPVGQIRPAPQRGTTEIGWLHSRHSFSFGRYYETSGLFGTPADCVAVVDRLKQIGVDEVACLIDFGIDSETVFAHLTQLDELRERCAARESTDAGDYSIAAQVLGYAGVDNHGLSGLELTLDRPLAGQAGRETLVRDPRKVGLKLERSGYGCGAI